MTFGYITKSSKKTLGHHIKEIMTENKCPSCNYVSNAITKKKKEKVA
jgi:hypothetical protein